MLPSRASGKSSIPSDEEGSMEGGIPSTINEGESSSSAGAEGGAPGTPGNESDTSITLGDGLSSTAVGRVNSMTSLPSVGSRDTQSNSVGTDNSISQFSYGSTGGMPRTGGGGPQKRRTSIKALQSVSLDYLGEVADGDDDNEQIGALTMPPRSSRHGPSASRGNMMFSVVSRNRSGGALGTGSGSTDGTAKAGGAGGSGAGGGSGSGESSMMGKGFRSTFALKNHKKTSRTGPQSGSNASTRSGVGSGGSGERRGGTSNIAIDPLAQLEGAEGGWESVAAAAALVASEADAGKASSKHHHRYGVGDRVLVSLTVMNATLGGAISSDLPFNDEEEGEVVARERIEALKESSTLVPVNKCGFPPGGAPVGSPPEHHRGPYGYVLATVARVHFEEDAQYYTVTRADTNTDQRADAEWMEPLTSEAAYEAALRAAQTTKKSTEAEKNRLDASGSKRGVEWFQVRIWNKVVGAYRAARVHAKVQIAKFLYGNSPYGFDLQFSGVNFLVLCSFIYMFIDNVRLAFFAASSDWAVMILTTVVWSILVVELLFEVLVRPEGYSALLASEKAYAPSTARFINGFHLFFEIVALALFIPDFRCFASKDCGAAYPFSVMEASLNTVLGPTSLDAFVGHLYFLTTRLRVFNLVRHWKTMWINHTFDEPLEHGSFVKGYWIPTETKSVAVESQRGKSVIASKKTDIQFTARSLGELDHDKEAEEEKAAKERTRQAKRADKRLSKAATIGTALMVVNSHRAMVLIVAIIGILPIIYCALDNGGTNIASLNSVRVLNDNNVLVPGETSCEYLQTTIQAWISSLVNVNVNTNDGYKSSERTDTLLLWAQLLPARCGMREDGVITICPDWVSNDACDEWSTAPADEISVKYFADSLNLRSGVIATHSVSQIVTVDGVETVFNATAMFNEGHTVAYANFSSFLLQSLMLLLILSGLTILRGDAGHLVLDPLRRMLKIVLRYATNPLQPTETKRKKKARSISDDDISIDSDSDIEYAEKNELGNYETEQLIRAIAKITDLLRKCWGVAGAGIISTNLARTQDGKTVVFNPTVAGRRVYALFGFAGIVDFGHLLRNLDQDVMILINDIAKIVHEEVYRYGLGDSGQCNKNLGAAFLMVYRIGDFKEVQEKKARATEVIFTSSEEKSKKTSQAVKRRGRGVRKKRQPTKELDTLQLASLPGIQAFTDRALLGMLKSLAGIHRDRSLLKWTKDFRLGAGVDAFSLGLIFGMDAGWGVEGAVGSEYKIDATYLSPHVNMASRMMSACKQYGVNILLSQAVEKLLSSQARSKLRHIDTVTVKGSTLKQQIFTYDSRHRGVDFYLFGRSPAQADADSDSYTPNIWNTDQDLKAMRQHISPDFERAFKEGRKAYLAGKWDHAISRLEIADRCMIETALDEGFHEYEVQGYVDQLLKPESSQDDEELIRLRAELGDGPCRSLLAYMKEKDGVAPDSWRGVRPLTSK